MKTIRKFKVSENQKRYDIVELKYDENERQYIVTWRWTSMLRPVEKKYETYKEAFIKYQERKEFAIFCN